MVTGYNTDIEYNDRIYHVQTEDKGVSNPVIESLIYVGGEILASHRTAYDDLLGKRLDEKALSARVERQHQRMIMDIRQGKFEPGGVRPFGHGIISERGFEEVVREYLTTELREEALQISVDSPAEFIEGETVELILRTRGEVTAMPVGGARVSVLMISAFDKPLTLAEGETSPEGILRLPVFLPRVEGGDAAALVFRASLDGETREAKSLLRKPGA